MSDAAFYQLNSFTNFFNFWAITPKSQVIVATIISIRAIRTSIGGEIDIVTIYSFLSIFLNSFRISFEEKFRF